MGIAEQHVWISGSSFSLEGGLDGPDGLDGLDCKAVTFAAGLAAGGHL